MNSRITIIANSNAVADDVREVLSAKNVVVLHNAIDVQHFSPRPGPAADLDAGAGMKPSLPGVVRVGLPATYARWKGHLASLNAAACSVARQESFPLRFYIIGGPIYHTAGSQWTEPELRSRIERLRLTDHVGLIPFQTDMAPVYRGLDMVVHASTEPEPFGRIVVESMASGCATIVSRAGGAVELFTEGHDAIGVTPGDVGELAAAIERLAGDPDLRRRLGQNGRETAVTKFNRYRRRAEFIARGVVSRLGA